MIAAKMTGIGAAWVALGLLVGCGGGGGGNCIGGEMYRCAGSVQCGSSAAGCEDTHMCCGDAQPQQGALLASTPPDSQQITIDPNASAATVSSPGSSSATVPVNGRMNVRFDEVHSEIDRVELGTPAFALGGANISGVHLLNDGILPASTGDGLIFVGQGDAKALVDGLVDNFHKWGEFVSDHDLLGNYDGISLSLDGSFSNGAGQSVSFHIAGTAQPPGTDTDQDGVPDVSDNCPAVANASQAKVAAPGIVAPPALTVTHCSGSVTAMLGQPTLTDVCGAAPVSVTNNAPSTFPLGTTTVTWTASDSAGNVSSATQLVTVEVGNDASCCPAGSHVIMGTSNNDTLVGTSGVDCIIGLGGQDRISGGGGNDVISGGDGDDVISGDAGDDVLSGGQGQDHVTGGDGNDLILGDAGDDVCSGGNGNDVLLGGAGQDQLSGDANDDTLNGGPGFDRLDGGLGMDVCSAGGDVDTYTACETRN